MQVRMSVCADVQTSAHLHNPEFHQRAQLRLSTWNTPRMVRCYEEDLDRLYLPRGLLDEAAKVVGAAGSRLKVEDRRPVTPTKPFTFTGELSSAQEDAVAELARHDLGVLIAPTGAGKTVMACALIARLATPTLVLVHTKPLAEQWRQRLGDLLGLQRRESASSAPDEPGVAALSIWSPSRPWRAARTLLTCSMAMGW